MLDRRLRLTARVRSAPSVITVAVAPPLALMELTLRPASRPVNVTVQASPVSDFSTETLPSPIRGSALRAERTSAAVAVAAIGVVTCPSKESLNGAAGPADNVTRTCSDVASPRSRVVLVRTKRLSPASKRVSVPPRPSTTSSPVPPLSRSSPSEPVIKSSPPRPIRETPLPPKPLASMVLEARPPVMKAYSIPLRLSVRADQSELLVIRMLLANRKVSSPRRVWSSSSRVSNPPPPLITSLPPAPVNRSSPLPPIRVSLSLRPSRVMPAGKAATTFPPLSTLPATEAPVAAVSFSSVAAWEPLRA